MDNGSLSHRVRETAKLSLRRNLGRVGLDIGRDPYVHRLVRALRTHGTDTVLDIGANVGQYAALLRSAGFAGRIISVEPLQSAYATLASRASRDPLWTAINAGVGASRTEVVLNVSANSYSSSVLPMEDAHLAADPNSRVVGTETVTLTTVVDLVDEHGVDPHKCLLKIDTQGYETEVLAGAGDLLDRFAGVQLELSFVELYTGQQLFDALVARMRGHGFEMWSLDPGISDASGRLLQCDGLFIRSAVHA